jgi:hypothetical protein
MIERVEESLRRLFLGGAGVRREDRKKVREVAALLEELSRLPRAGLLVDAAAGHAYVGLLAAEILAWRRVVVLERDPARIERCRHAAAHLSTEIDVRAGDVADRALWPERPDVVVALHACGAASDAVLDAAIGARARWLLLVPCCYARDTPFSPRASEIADQLGLPRHAEVRRRAVEALIAAERTLRLEAAGWETTVLPLVPPTVTPHNLLYRARFAGEPRRMAEAAEKLRRLTAGRTPGSRSPSGRR